MNESMEKQMKIYKTFSTAILLLLISVLVYEGLGLIIQEQLNGVLSRKYSEIHRGEQNYYIQVGEEHVRVSVSNIRDNKDRLVYDEMVEGKCYSISVKGFKNNLFKGTRYMNKLPNEIPCQ